MSLPVARVESEPNLCLEERVGSTFKDDLHKGPRISCFESRLKRECKGKQVSNELGLSLAWTD